MNKKTMDLQVFSIGEINNRLYFDFASDFRFPLQDPTNALMNLHSAWYAGDPILLNRTYKGLVDQVGGAVKESFWAKKTDDGIVKLHVPVASDIAMASSDTLFAEMPEISIPEDDENATDGEAAMERLDEIIEESGFANRLLEAAESCAAMGGVYLVPTWDMTIADHPILAVNQADNAIPTFKWGYLVKVAFFKVVYEDTKNNVCYRLLEQHEAGWIRNALYKGTSKELGDMVPLNTFPATENLPEAIATGWDKLMVRYIPNMKPNRRFRGSAHGQSDFAGLEPLLDALDEIYSSWMRDIRLARARIIVPEAFLDFEDNDDGSKTPYFDVDRSVYTKLAMDPLTAKESGLTLHQFAIRAEEHRQSAYELLERIVTHAGYSPQTFGLNVEGRSDSGTALNIRERRTFVTRGKKWKYWKHAIEDILEMMLHIDSFIFRNPTPVLRPSVELGDSMNSDMVTMASALQALNNAQAVSIDTKVRLLNPDWSEEAIEAEVEAIKEEQGIGQEPVLPNPLNPMDTSIDGGNIDGPEDMEPEDEIGLA